jgi:ABC-type molybdate transport system substrate-binding protein
MSKQFVQIRIKLVPMVVIVTILLALATLPATAAQKVIIFHAGSLTVPLAEIEKRFDGPDDLRIEQARRHHGFGRLQSHRQDVDP